MPRSSGHIGNLLTVVLGARAAMQLDNNLSSGRRCTLASDCTMRRVAEVYGGPTQPVQSDQKKISINSAGRSAVLCFDDD